MKLTKQLLKQLIKEQLKGLMQEGGSKDSWRKPESLEGGTAVGSRTYGAGDIRPIPCGPTFWIQRDKDPNVIKQMNAHPLIEWCPKGCVQQNERGWKFCDWEGCGMDRPTQEQCDAMNKIDVPARLAAAKTGRGKSRAFCIQSCMKSSKFRAPEAQKRQHCAEQCREYDVDLPVTQKGAMQPGPSLGLQNCDQLTGRKRRRCERRNNALLKKSKAGKAYGETPTEKGLPGGVGSAQCKEGALETINGVDMTCKNGKWLKLQGSQKKWGAFEESQYSSFPEQKKLFENLRNFADNKKEDK